MCSWIALGDEVQYSAFECAEVSMHAAGHPEAMLVVQLQKLSSRTIEMHDRKAGAEQSTLHPRLGPRIGAAHACGLTGAQLRGLAKSQQ